MVRLQVIDPNTDHFVIYADEPVRIEVSKTREGQVIAHVYERVEVDKEQEPLGVYDGTIGEHNTGWEKK